MTEMLTAATNVLLAVVVFGWMALLRQRYRRVRQRSILAWSGGFLAIAMSAVFGALYHALSGIPDGALHLALWMGIYVFLSCAEAFFFVGCLMTWVERLYWPWLLRPVLVPFVTYVGLLLGYQSFKMVIFGYLLTLAVLFIFGGIRITLKNHGGGAIIAGVVILLLAGLVQVSSLAIGPLNHDGLSHLIMLPGLFLLYKVGLLLKDKA